MKNVNALVVKYAALLLIETNQKTTTLEVKQLLRDIGYFAEQEEISIFMEQAALELPLEWTDVFSPVPHREYKVPATVPVTLVTSPVLQDDDDEEDDDDTVNMLSQVVNNMATPTDDDDDDDAPDMSFLSQVTPRMRTSADFEYQTKLGDTVLLFSDPYTIINLGGTVFRQTNGDAGSFYFCQNVGRDLARSAHAGVTPDDYNDVRSQTYTG